MNPQPNPTTSAHAGEYLSFRLGREEYGIPILAVQEIRGYTEPTRLAHPQPHLKGVVNLRGVIVPIVDLRLKLGMPAAYNDLTATIVLNIGGKVTGIVVDAVSDVLALTPAQIKQPPSFANSGGADTPYVTGIGTQTRGEAEAMLILVDIECLLAGDGTGLLDTAALAA
ncbi:MAG: chemotaxis protein CheW [Burkholderiaceae bacterium]